MFKFRDHCLRTLTYFFKGDRNRIFIEQQFKSRRYVGNFVWFNHTINLRRPLFQLKFIMVEGVFCVKYIVQSW